MSMGFVKSAYIKENFGGNKMFKKLKEKKGFTLVELIVVLVILAILAALLIPTLTGYIDKANQEKVVSECRMVVMAVQTELSESYGKAGAGKSLDNGAWKDTPAEGSNAAKANEHITEIKKLSEVLLKDGTSFDATAKSDATITKVEYRNGKYKCVYEKGAYTTSLVKDDDAALNNSVTISE